MNQTELTTHSTEESPADFRLSRARDGWSGGNEHFRIINNVIKIKNSDGDPSIVPTEQQRRKTYDEFGNYSQYVQQYKTDDVFQLWMSKIGPYLADWALDMRNDPTALTLPWRLIDFPAGYTLWVHLTGESRDPANPRTDAYLYGSPHKIFRSPMEFVEHAIWLMKRGGSSGRLQCLCKYCTPGQSQRAINSRLNHGLDGDDDEDGSDGAAAGPAATGAALSALRHPIFRRRPGAGAVVAATASARARRERRTAKRERSPGIKAKDYRVGNFNGGGGDGSGAGGSAGGMAT